MESKTKLLGHPAHTILIVFPLGLLSTSVLFDLLFFTSKKPQFSQASFWMLLSGLAGGGVAAPFGLRDWLAVPDGTRAKRVGRWHGLGNAAALSLFGASAGLRRGADKTPSAPAVMLSLLGGGLAFLSGWLGGELVDRLGVGVDDGANLDAPNSLTGRPASGEAA